MDVMLSVLECNQTTDTAVEAPRYVSKNNGFWLFEQELMNNQVFIQLKP